MEAWWAADGKTLTDQLTGKMPILLEALAAVKVENSCEGADIAINIDVSSNTGTDGI
jgi:hypothetical protein